MPDSRAAASRHQPTLAVPLAEAKNHLSALVARVEQGEEIAITRRGVPVARLVPDFGDRQGRDGCRAQVAVALKRLQQLQTGSLLKSNLQMIARKGLD